MPATNESRAREALMCIRGVVLGPVKSEKEKIVLINEIVGEGAFGDFLGTIEAAYDDGRASR